MPPKAKIPAPIDRPLSRAYLREFSGWSTAYPPGTSEPTSLRVMENTLINRDGSMRIRPGMKYLSYVEETPEEFRALPVGQEVVGSHEVFFLSDGGKAYLFAVRENDGTVGFRVARFIGGEVPFLVLPLDHEDVGFAVPEDLNFEGTTTYVKYVQIDNRILALSDAGEEARIFWVGEEKKAKRPKEISRPDWIVADKPTVIHPRKASIDDPVGTPSLTTPATKTTATLIPTAATTVEYYAAYYYTFSNELGETGASQARQVRLKRRWTAWSWDTPNGDVEPSGTETDDETKVADQLHIFPSDDAFAQAKVEEATHFNVYAIMWSDQDPVPVEGTLVDSIEINSELDRVNCYVRHSPAPMNAARTMLVPNRNNRFNYSAPTRAKQGVVAMDRLILVGDPEAGAVIKWTSNEMGEYLNFTGHRGGGFKTLTSGNLYLPVNVKLWQNPESKDTITILCIGVDGYSTAYYMAPAQVASQSDAVNIMGFEETTATPGTVSPYGVEVQNNALFHPLDEMLMKTTASNYNINHKAMTDQIQNKWAGLVNKELIVSSLHDNRLYYLVNNPEGDELEPGCWGNEVWVFDTASETGTWSRWKVQGCSLRKIEVNGVVGMSITRPEGIYFFDDTRGLDDYVEPVSREVFTRAIPWYIETNTQGANRAHDAWANLQQLGVTFGNLVGTVRWGITGGYDVNGKAVEMSKITRNLEDPDDPPAPGLFDFDDFLQVRRSMKEWRFFAGSVLDAEDGVLPCFGQISAVAYRYTPVSVNVGYEYGSVETFEYGRAVDNWAERTTDNGVPIPMNDTRRP